MARVQLMSYSEAERLCREAEGEALDGYYRELQKCCGSYPHLDLSNYGRLTHIVCSCCRREVSGLSVFSAKTEWNRMTDSIMFAGQTRMAGSYSKELTFRETMQLEVDRWLHG